MEKRRHGMILLFAIALFAVSGIKAQTPEFTYQGKLNDGGIAANGNYDFEFALFDALGAGSQIGATIPKSGVAVTNGIFSVMLDFGSVFPGANRYLEIRVRLSGQPGITTLTPRQLLNSAPYSVKSLNTDTATNATQLGGVAANQYVVTTDPRMTDARNPLPNSGNYIWNQNSVLQTSSNFIISGNGDLGGTLSASIVNATTQYRIGGNRVLSAGGNNLFAGVGSGSTGINNSFFGRDSGGANLDGNNNSFFGYSSGSANSGGSDNSFFGAGAGDSNVNGAANAFFGTLSGDANTSGSSNSFFGWGSGGLNEGGGDNSFFGRRAGLSNISGSGNSFFGRDSGFLSTGGSNSFFGQFAGNTNTTGSNNTVIGQGADVSIGALTYATAIGSDAVVTSSARVQLGRNGLDTVRIGELSAATATQLCINSNNVLSACSSSGRYKENIRPFASGRNLVKKLRPVTFDWIEGKNADLGLIAEEVAQVEPLLVTTNAKGEVEGVKYDRISVVLVNAIKEQQSQIEAQQKQIDQQNEIIKKQQADLDALKALVCSQNPTAFACKPKN